MLDPRTSPFVSGRFLDFLVCPPIVQVNYLQEQSSAMPGVGTTGPCDGQILVDRSVAFGRSLI